MAAFINTAIPLEEEMDALVSAPARRGRPELAIQRSIIAFIARACPQADVRAIPNDSRAGRDKLRRHREGVRAGTPDLVVIAPGGVTVWLECKTPKGRRSDAQQATHARWAALGHRVAVVRSIEDAETALRQAGVVLSGSALGGDGSLIRQRGWECAHDLLENWRDRLEPDSYARCLAARKAGPDGIMLAQAEAMQRLHRKLVGVRR